MGWQEARKKHKASGSVNSQGAEDLVARRVLRGLGYVQKDLPALERAYRFRDTWDDPLWARVRRVMDPVMRESGVKLCAGSCPGLYDIEVREVTNDHASAEKLFKELIDDCRLGDPPLPLFLTRVKGTTVSRAYFPVYYGQELAGCTCHVDSGLWKPPFTVVSRLTDTLWLMCQDTEHFVAQLGPYKKVEAPEA